MSYYEDGIKQFKQVMEQHRNENIKDVYNKRLEKIFLGIYAINYLSNRVELNKFFISNYYNVSFSCVLESFSLILNNYPRGSALVLRSGLENFVKYVIEVSNNISGSNYTINDRSYSENKKTLEIIIRNKYVAFLQERSISINSQMETYYKLLSGLSHSLVPESKSNTISYFSEIYVVNNTNVELVFEKLLNIIKEMFEFCVILCQPSFKEWDSYDLEKIFRLVFASDKSKKLLTLLKSV